MAARPGKRLNHAEEIFRALDGRHHTEEVFKAICHAKGVPAEKVKERWATVFKLAKKLAEAAVKAVTAGEK
jgi:hypothetical protein